MQQTKLNKNVCSLLFITAAWFVALKSVTKKNLMTVAQYHQTNQSLSNCNIEYQHFWI